MSLLSIDSKLANTPFFQQNMKHCTPIYHPLIVVAIFGFLGIIFVPVGFTLMNQADKLYETKKEHFNGGNERFQIDIPYNQLNQHKSLNLYYQLEDFHQNVRSYADSFNIDQLTTSDEFSKFGLDENCSKTSVQENILNEPCGLIWKTRVQDTYKLSIVVDSDTNQTEELNFDLDILRKEDINSNRLFGQTFKQMPNWQIYGAWMRPAAFPLVTKSYGRISQGQWVNKTIQNEENNTIYRFILECSGDYQYKDKRNVILTQMTQYGGKSETKNLGILSIVFGFISFICALLFLIIYFVWRKNQPVYQQKIKDLEEESNKRKIEMQEVLIQNDQNQNDQK